MNQATELQIPGLGPVGVRLLVAHLKKHADRKHLLAVNGPGGLHNIEVAPGHVDEAAQALLKLISRPQFLSGVYRGTLLAA